MQNVLVHQRARWGALLAHQRQYEGWWKAEFRLALESWCWRSDLPEPTRVRSEEKPRNHGVGASPKSVDLLISQRSDDAGDMLPRPRVWVEIKERGTWWGNARKALGESNRGLWSDLRKWQGVSWARDDVVVACHILTHEASPDKSVAIPPPWAAAFEEAAAEFPRYVPTLTVRYPCANSGSQKVVERYASIDFFTIHRPPPG